MWAQGMARLAEQGTARGRELVEGLAEALVEQARANTSSNGSHSYGTPTPASPGGGPAQISGTLTDSIGHSEPVPDLGGWSIKVGPRTGQYPPYGRRATSADRYGYYLETGLRNGATYPWLKPAADAVAAGGALAAAGGVLNSLSWQPVF